MGVVESPFLPGPCERRLWAALRFSGIATPPTIRGLVGVVAAVVAAVVATWLQIPRHGPQCAIERGGPEAFWLRDLPLR